jgi:hypothetical protein
MKTKLILTFGFLLCMVQLTSAQEPSLRLGALEMHLGSSQTDVMPYLTKNYDLKQMDSPDAYLIFQQRLNKTDEFKSVGQVAFEKGKLIYAVKNWYTESTGGSYNLVDALYTVLAQLARNGQNMATIELGYIREPGETVQEIKLRFGKKWIDITASDFRGSKGALVTETISAR